MKKITKGKRENFQREVNRVIQGLQQKGDKGLGNEAIKGVTKNKKEGVNKLLLFLYYVIVITVKE